MLNSNHLKRMFIFWSVIAVVLVSSVIAVVWTKHVLLPATVQNSTSVSEVDLPYVYVVLPGSVPVTPADIMHFFGILPAALALYNTNPDVPAYRHARVLDTYVFQLFVTRHADGSLIVQVYALPPRRQLDPIWSTAPIDIDDGGPEYFDATVNLTTNVVTDIFVHGEA